tara:strand:+ start:252 stop:950 length:699 start_codon:yes stop_codon:yes gene_type:complete
MFKKIIPIFTIALLPNIALANYDAEVSLSTASSIDDSSKTIYSLNYSQVIGITEKFSTQIDLYYNDLSNGCSCSYNGAMLHLMYDVNDNLTFGIHRGLSDEDGSDFIHQGIEVKYILGNFDLELSYSGESSKGSSFASSNYWYNSSVIYNLNEKSSIGVQTYNYKELSWDSDTRYKFSYNHNFENNFTTKVTYIEDSGNQEIKLELIKKFGNGKTMSDKSWIGGYLSPFSGP